MWYSCGTHVVIMQKMRPVAWVWGGAAEGAGLLIVVEGQHISRVRSGAKSKVRGRSRYLTGATRMESWFAYAHGDGMAQPWTASWHPYFQVSDVSKARVQFDSSCEWRHLSVPPGGPRGGSLTLHRGAQRRRRS